AMRSARAHGFSAQEVVWQSGENDLGVSGAQGQRPSPSSRPTPITRPCIRSTTRVQAPTRLRMIHSVPSAERRATMPRPPTTKALEEALEKLQHAREDFAQAFEGLLAQLDLSAVGQALADWRHAAEVFREEAQRVHEDASTYFDDRSEHWQDSEKG